MIVSDPSRRAIRRVERPTPSAAYSAAHLVGLGFRGWMTGLTRADLSNWAHVWTVYEQTAGPVNARRMVTDLACWVQRIQTTTEREIEVCSSDCIWFGRDECVALSLIAAAQHDQSPHRRCPAMQACAAALLGTDNVEPVLDTAVAFAGTLIEAGQILQPEQINLLHAQASGREGDSPLH